MVSCFEGTTCYCWVVQGMACQSTFDATLQRPGPVNLGLDPKSMIRDSLACHSVEFAMQNSYSQGCCHVHVKPIFSLCALVLAIALTQFSAEPTAH